MDSFRILEKAFVADYRRRKGKAIEKKDKRGGGGDFNVFASTWGDGKKAAVTG